ncbi:helix-turn-helix domain-containing protein [Streptomyces sp. NPDC059578]|uniref:helix-turn-helix domain-containing protein n=1 Tax=Streptomyces sp. NPDC059578 TaxID=3346874 RepID=UPI0036B31640
MMAKNRQAGTAGIAEVSFAAPAGTPPGIEVLSLAELRARAGPDRLTAPQRVGFHHLLTVASGTLRHTVDFTAHTLRRGSWLWVRPGQVQQWGDLTGADGALVLFQQDFLDGATAVGARLDDVHGPAVRTPATADVPALDLAVAHLDQEFRSFGHLPLAVHTATLRHLLAVLVLRLSHLDGADDAPSPGPDGTHLRFRNAVEEHFARTRRVADYADLLGYSPRTLSRAALAATGTGAKEFIDRRVVLEAKRLLAHSDDPASRIADRLGFPSPTHFSKFFHHRTGQTPSDFRVAVRSGATRGPGSHR